MPQADAVPATWATGVRKKQGTEPLLQAPGEWTSLASCSLEAKACEEPPAPCLPLMISPAKKFLRQMSPKLN